MNLPNPMRCNVLVAGGGVAGVPAAVAAARLGMSVVLLEREAFLGGAGVSALHRYICGLYLNGDKPPADTLNAGIQREIVDRLCALSPSSAPVRLGRVWGFPFETEHLKTVYTDLARQEANLTIVSSSALESVRCESGRIVTMTMRTADGTREIAASAVVDCTGSGEVIRLSGAPFKIAPDHERQTSGCTFQMDGIEGDRELLGVKIAWLLSRLPADETVELPFFAGFAPGAEADDGFCKLSVPPDLARMGEAHLAGLIVRFHAILAEHLPELRNSRVLRHSGVMEREGIRLMSEWELDEASILDACRFPDGVVRNAWPIEFWDQTGVPGYAYMPDGAHYEIPRRCLHSRSIKNLYAGGRCIAASSRALASIRVMGTCMALGEAAGKEAALFAQHNPL